MAIDIQAIKRRSQQAICGTFEKEIVVDAANVQKVKRTLRASGFTIIGTGAGPFGKTKIWYNPSGFNF